MNHTGPRINPATSKGYKRSRTSAWCCGHNYQRWRFINLGRRYPGNHPTHCPTCGQPLVYRRIKKATLDRYYRNRSKLWAAGLTTLGAKPRRKNFNIRTPLEKDWMELRRQVPPVPHIEDVFNDRNSIYE